MYPFICGVNMGDSHVPPTGKEPSRRLTFVYRGIIPLPLGGNFPLPLGGIFPLPLGGILGHKQFLLE